MSESKKSRAAIAADLRDSGKTYKEIALSLGGDKPISTSRARQLAHIGYKKREIAEDPIGQLSSRCRSAIMFAGLETKDHVRLAIDSGQLKPGSIYNFGKKSYAEICAWLGVEVEKKLPPMKSIALAIRLLERHGYKVEKILG